MHETLHKAKTKSDWRSRNRSMTREARQLWNREKTMGSWMDEVLLTQKVYCGSEKAQFAFRLLKVKSAEGTRGKKGVCWEHRFVQQIRGVGGDERFLEKVLEFLLEQSRTCFGDTELFPPWLVMTYEKAEDAFSLDWKHLLFTVFLYKVTIKEYFF